MNVLDRAKVHTDRLAAWLVAGLGFLVLFLGYRGTSGTGLIAQQLSYIVSGGIVGLSLVGVGAVLWLSADLRDQWRELYEIRELLERQDERSSTVAGAAPSQPENAESAAVPVTPSGKGRTPRSAVRVARPTARRVTETT